MGIKTKIMKGNTFTAPDGKTHKVLDFDEINKMAYIRVFAESYRWVHESEYSTWQVNDTAIMPKIYIPDIPAQMVEPETIPTDEKVSEEVTEEKPKKKTTKKKTDAAN